RLRPVILQLDDFTTEAAARNAIALLGGRVRRFHNKFRLMTVELKNSRVRDLEADDNFTRVSPDREVTSQGHLEVTTAAAQARTVVNNSTLDGSGVGIAILDSGIDASHQLLAGTGGSRVVYSQDFTSDNITGDTYGHGTHVASLAAGAGSFENGAYTGVAPGASLIIAALDWCIANKDAYNIRVINLSLGSIAADSYQFDPLCLAARRAHDAGIVVVCASGNDGKDAQGQKVYGTIHSPGDDPSVITVGAANTFGTDARSDDTVTTYSSRGPTRGYYNDDGGVKHYDNLIKPDLVAPGNKLIGAQSSNPRSALLPNNLIQHSPALDTRTTIDPTARTMYLSGTSMAAPVVAGAAALLVQANPGLTPNLVKAILIYSAQPLQGVNTFEQGAGLLNVEGAVRI